MRAATAKRAVRKLPVVAPASRAAFECSACGACCHTWAVSVDRKTYEGLAAHLARPGQPRSFTLAETTHLAEHPTDLEYATLARRDGHCVFLEDDQLCYLHKHFGAESKPIACRAFPSKAAATTSGGHFLFPTFGCGGMIASLAKTAGQLELVRDAAAPSLVPGQSTARLSDTTFVGFDVRQRSGVTASGFDALMLGLRRLLAIEGAPLPTRLLGARLWIDDLAAGGRWHDGRAIDASLDALLADGGAALHGIAAGVVREQPAVYLRVMATILARRAALGPVQARAAHWLETPVSRYALAQSPAAEAIERLRADVAASLAPAPPRVDAILLSYVADKLFYNSEYFRVGIVGGFHSVLALHALVRLLAVSHAAARAAVVDERTVLAAIEAVDRHFGHTTQLFDFWSNADNTETLRLPFAAAMVGC